MTTRVFVVASVLLLALVLLASVLVSTGISQEREAASANELTDVGEGDAEALLAAVLLGCENARARVSTGVGKVTEYEWHLDKNKEVLESESEYSVIFDGEKCRAGIGTRLLTNERVLPDDPGISPIPLGVVRTEEIAYDGETLVAYSPLGEYASISGQCGTRLNWIRFLAKMMATGGPDPTRVALGPPTHERRGPWLKGRQVVDGEECVVVEVAYVHTAEEGGEISLNDTFWISPRMGFATLKMETRCYGGKYGDEGMLSAEVTTQTREWGDGHWCISRMESKQYARDDESGSPYLYYRTVTTLADDFQINAPVTDDMLTVDLLSGTKVYNELIDAEYTVP